MKIRTFCLLTAFLSVNAGYDELIKNAEQSISDYVEGLNTAITGFLNENATKLYFTPEEYFAPTCIQCTVGINFVKLFKNFMTAEQMKSYAVKACKTLFKYPFSVCSKGIDLIIDDVFYALENSDMRTKHICNFFFDTCDNSTDSRHDWKVTFPSTKKSAAQYIIGPAAASSMDKPKLKVLHITDLHFDPYYQEGSDADCEYPLCCRASSGWPKSNETAAGKWGDYRKCDAPKILLESAFQHIVDTYKDIAYVLWTGDAPPHDVWNQTREGNLNTIKDISDLLTKYFKEIPIFPAAGNHESCPMDSYVWTKTAPKNRSMSYLYEALASEWSKWLPADTNIETIKLGAFYSAKFGNKFRIISLNDNYCSTKNLLLILNSTDPMDQLAWLVSQLDDAEKNGEKVHIITHVPPGTSDCLKTWSWNYYDIINRYENVVAAQFHGHTHFDEFKVFYDTADLKRPLGIAYVGPSLTPWKDNNPAYRIYHIDGDYEGSTGMVLDYETWTMDLARANKDNKPVWKKSYEAKNLYNMRSLLPTDWDNLIYRMVNDTKLFDTYFKNYFRNATERSCKEECRKTLLCDLRSGRSRDRENLCRNLFL